MHRYYNNGLVTSGHTQVGDTFARLACELPRSSYGHVLKDHRIRYSLGTPRRKGIGSWMNIKSIGFMCGQPAPVNSYSHISPVAGQFKIPVWAQHSRSETSWVQSTTRLVDCPMNASRGLNGVRRTEEQLGVHASRAIGRRRENGSVLLSLMIIPRLVGVEGLAALVATQPWLRS